MLESAVCTCFAINNASHTVFRVWSALSCENVHVINIEWLNCTNNVDFCYQLRQDGRRYWGRHRRAGSASTQVTPLTDLSMVTSSKLQREAPKSSAVKEARRELEMGASSITQMRVIMNNVALNVKIPLNAIKQALAPISLLLPEFFRFIFALAVSSMHNDQYSHTSLHISHVSRTWRANALECSSIWTCIHTEWRTRYQNVWFSRARYQAFHIAAHCANAYRASASRIRLSAKIGCKSYRWESFSAYNFGFGDLQIPIRPALCHGLKLSALKSITHFWRQRISPKPWFSTAPPRITTFWHQSAITDELRNIESLPLTSRQRQTNQPIRPKYLEHFSHKLTVLVVDNIGLDTMNPPDQPILL